MEAIIDPVSIELLKSELTIERKVCDTNKADNEVYIVDCHNAPNVVREIGRLREIAFREAGGSSGLSCDLDEFDLMENPYQQIVIWDPSAEKIIGGYRYILGPDIRLREDGQPHLATSHMFYFSQLFIDEYLPHIMELGRSFVAPEYQSSKAGAKAIYALDNLWDGIGAVMLANPDIFWFFGKMTMYPSYDRACRDLILHFLWKHFPDEDELVRPYNPEMPVIDGRLMDLILKEDEFKPDYRLLKDAVRKLGTSIPPLINSYMNISPTMKMLGTAVNDEFSDVEETGILIAFDEMHEDKRERHKEPFAKHLLKKMLVRFPLMRDSDDVVERISKSHTKLRKRSYARFMKNKEKIKE